MRNLTVFLHDIIDILEIYDPDLFVRKFNANFSKVYSHFLVHYYNHVEK